MYHSADATFLRFHIETVTHQDDANGGTYDHDYHYRRVEFLASNGQNIQITGKAPRAGGSLEPGDLLKVLYDPLNPDDAVINSFRERYWWSIVWGVIGIVAIGFSVAALRAVQRQILGRCSAVVGDSHERKPVS